MPSTPPMPELLLRPWREADAPALLRLYRSNPDLGRQLPVLDGLPAARAAIESWRQEWVFALTERGVAIGSVGITNLDRSHQTGWFWYWLAGPARGRGIASRAAATVADWALFEAPQPLYRLELGHRLTNPASQRVAEAAGFIREGIERQKLAYGRERFDVAVCARLRTDPRPDREPIELAMD